MMAGRQMFDKLHRRVMTDQICSARALKLQNPEDLAQTSTADQQSFFIPAVFRIAGRGKLGADGLKT
jgi:hypothetical protein